MTRTPSHLSNPPTSVLKALADSIHLTDRGVLPMPIDGRWSSQAQSIAYTATADGLHLEVDGHPAFTMGMDLTLVVPEFTVHRILGTSDALGTVVAQGFRLRAFKTLDVCQLLPLPMSIGNASSALLDRPVDEDNSLAAALRRRARCLDFAAALVAAAPPETWSAAGIAALGRIHPAVSLIEAHFAEPLTRADLAAACDLGPSRFHQLFITALRVAPMAWLRRYRLQRARALLRLSQGSIEAVANTCGFGDPFHFSRSFRSVYGVSPSSLRADAAG
jgi:AraC-like DNA-binding protein